MSKNTFKTIALLFVLVLIVPQVSAALNVDSWFSNGKTSMAINPGENALYGISSIGDYGASSIDVSANIIDYTTGTQIDNGELVHKTHHPSDSQDVFFDVEDTVLPADYNNLPGDYLIKIKVEQMKNGLKTIETNELQLTVTGNRLPVVDFTWTPQNPTTDDTVTFTATGSDDDGTIVKYEWYVDGTKIGEGKTINKKFSSAKTYSVKVIATDNDGGKASKTRNVVVSQGAPVNVAPVMKSIPNQQINENQYFSYNLEVSDANGDSLSCYVVEKPSWLSLSASQCKLSGTSPSVSSDTSYYVKVGVTDSKLSDEQDFNIKVIDVPPQNVAPDAKFTFSPSSPKTNEVITFTSQSTDSDGTIVSQEWDFNNDGITDKTGKSVTHSFVNSGTKKVALKVKDNDGAYDSETKSVTVSMPTLEIFSLGCNANVVKGEIQHCSVELDQEIENAEITFRYSSPNSVKDEILGTCVTNFKGDCHINPTINKPEGYYDVYATARKTGYNPDNSKELTTTFRVWEKQYEIENLRTFEDPFVTEQYTFYRNNPVYASFDVRDLFTGQLVPPDSGLVEEVILRVNNADPLYFEPIGTFTLTKVSDSEINNYIQSSASKSSNSITSTNSAKQVSELAGEYKYKLNLIPITDDYLGQGKVFAFTFNFEDNTAGQGDVNVNILNNELTFDPVTYYLTKKGETITIDFKPDLSDVETQPKDVKITFGSTHLDISNTGNNVFKVKIPQNFEGFYIVFFTADDTDGSKVEVPIKFEVEEEELFPPHADFDWSPAEPVVKQSVTFTSKSTDSDGTISKHEWKIDGAIVSTSMSTQKTFSTSGTHTVTLKVTDNDGLSDTVTKNVYVKEPENVPPKADFHWTPQNPQVDEQVNFVSDSYDSDGTIQSYVWKIAGNTVSFEENFNYKFTQAGTYTVSLTVYDNKGASDSVTKTIVISEKPNLAPVAGFVWNPENPIQGQNVKFESDSYDSDGYINAYEWKIDGKIVSNDEKFDHVFSTTGTYEVQLTVWDDDGARSTVVNNIYVGEPENIAPVAEFDWSPKEPRVNDVVKFTSNSYDSDGTIVEYKWSVDSDYKGNNNVLNFVFSEKGYHYVTLKVTDNDGATDIITKTVYVKEALNIPPTADFTWEPAYPKAGEQVEFTSKAKDVDGQISHMVWESDGEFYIQDEHGIIVVQFPHTFEKAGIYYVTQTVTDDDGATATITKAIHVQEKDNIAPVVDFEWDPKNPIEGDEVYFQENAHDEDGTIVSYVWEIDGDVVSYKPDFEHTFASAGTYKVKLTVTDNDGASNYAVKYVTVSEPENMAPVADFEWKPQTPFIGDDVEFQSTSYDSDGSIVKYVWKINNVVVGYDSNYTQAFAYADCFDVSLTVTDDDGAQSIKNKQICVDEPANVIPVSKFHFEPTNPIVGQEVNFISDSYDVDGKIVKYLWEIEDINVGYGENYSQIFTHSSCFDVSLTVTDDDGAFQTRKQEICIGEKPNLPPVADFEWKPQTPIVGDDVEFQSTSYDSDGSIVKYVWKINNVVVGYDSNYTQAFAYADCFDVSLTVTDDDGATDSSNQEICIGEKPNVAPTAQFEYTPSNPVAGENVVLTSTSFDSDGYIAQYEWKVNGAYVGNTNQINNQFGTAGNYVVTLKVWDDDGAYNVATKTIYVNEPANIPPVADFHWEPAQIIEGQPVNFVSDSYDEDGYIVEYMWSLDGNGFYSQDISYTFDATGSYPVTLKVIDNKGAVSYKTMTVTVNVDPNKNAPIAILNMPGSTTMGTEVVIDGSSSYDPDGKPLKAYIWTIKKGSDVIDTFTTTNPKLRYVFNTRYTHTVELTVVDEQDLTGTTSGRIDVGKAKYESDGYGKDDGVFIDYFDVYGTDLDTIDMDEPYTISARVTNARDDKVNDMHLTFQIPELGYKISSSRFDIKAGQTKNVAIQDYLPFLPNEIEPGEYYALVSVAGDGIIRTKYYPLMIR